MTYQLTNLLLGMSLKRKKTHFQASQAWSLSGYKQLKLTTKLFTGCTSDSNAKCYLEKFGHAQKVKFHHSFWV